MYSALTGSLYTGWCICHKKAMLSFFSISGETRGISLSGTQNHEPAFGRYQGHPALGQGRRGRKNRAYLAAPRPRPVFREKCLDVSARTLPITRAENPALVIGNYKDLLARDRQKQRFSVRSVRLPKRASGRDIHGGYRISSRHKKDSPG